MWNVSFYRSLQFHNFPFLWLIGISKRQNYSLSLKLHISDQVKEVSDHFESATWKGCGYHSKGNPWIVLSLHKDDYHPQPQPKGCPKTLHNINATNITVNEELC